MRKARILLPLAGFLLLGLAAGFVFGLTAGRGVIPGFGTLNSFRVQILEPIQARIGTPVSPDELVVMNAFAQSAIPPFLRPPITSLDGINAANEEIFLAVEDFWSIPDALTVLGIETLDIPGELPVIAVRYELGGRERTAYAYGTLDHLERPALLIISGSGPNHARMIATDNRNSYQCCIRGAVADFMAPYVLLKQNEDLLAIHNGAGKLTETYFVNWHLNRGGSYSASYIADAAALAVALGQVHDQVAVAGLSQGGSAALIVSTLVPVSAVVVASGYSIYFRDWYEASGHGQIIIPGLYEHLAPERLAEALTMPALFTFGRADRSFPHDAEEGGTCPVLEAIPTVTCTFHDGAHVYDAETTAEFLSYHLGG